MRVGLRFAAIAAITLASVATAQAQEAKREVQGYFAGGYSSPEGIAGDYTNGGWNISGGTIIRPNPAGHFGIRFDLGYSYMGANSHTLNVANSSGLRVDDGYMSIWNLNAEGMWEFGNPQHVGGWIGAGIGGYRRYLQLTNTVITGGYVCDPWWGWCYPAAVPGDVIQADDLLTKFGASASAGITFGVGHGQLYVEARYHWMDTEKGTQYFPVLLGYRF